MTNPVMAIQETLFTSYYVFYPCSVVSNLIFSKTMAFFIDIIICKSTISPLNTGNIRISEDVKVGEGENQQLSVYEVRYEKYTIRARP